MTDYRSEASLAFIRYRQSLESGRVPAAVESAATVGESEDSIEELYADFETALNADDTELARTLVEQLSDRYDEIGGDEQAILQRVVTGLDANAYDTDDRESLLEFPRTMSKVNAQRTGFLLDALSAFESEDPVDTERLVDRATETREVESSLDSARQSTVSVVSDASVPPTPSIVTVDAPGSLAESGTVIITVVIENIGDEPTVPLELNISSGSELGTENEVTQIGKLDAREQRKSEIGVTGQAPGEHTITIEVTADRETIELTEESLTVLDTARSVREVIAGGQGATPEASDVRAALEYWAQNRQVPETGGETVDDRTLLTLIEDWRANKNGES